MPLVGALIGLAVVAVVAVASVAVVRGGLWLKSEDALAPLLNWSSVPVLLLSGILLPMTLGPRWLPGLSPGKPVQSTSSTARARAFARRATRPRSWSRASAWPSAWPRSACGIASRAFVRENA